MKIRLFFVFFLTAMLLSAGLMAAEKPLRLDLGIEDIVKVHFMDQTDIGLKLSVPATAKLRDLTAENIGKRLEVFYMNTIIVAATIQGAIDSGYVRVAHPSDFIRNEMKKLQEKLATDQK